MGIVAIDRAQTQTSSIEFFSSKASSLISRVCNFICGERGVAIETTDIPLEIDREALNDLLLIVITQFCSKTQKEVDDDCEGIYCAPTSSQAIASTVNLLIQMGIAPDEIESDFSRMGIFLPRSAFLDWKVLTEFGQKSPLGSLSSNLKAIRKTRSLWLEHNWSTILGAISIGGMIMHAVTPAAAASCKAPRGSYSDTCTVQRESSYRSTDPKLAHIDFCQFEIKCERVPGSSYPKVRLNSKTLAQEDVGCLTHFENCDGYLLPRAGNERYCTSPEGINQELRGVGMKDEL